MIDVSIVIVNWNTKELLLDCVQSLFDETLDSRIEIIVVDNASTDGSVDALRERFPQVRVFENSANLGFAKANNVGIRKASGRYVCLVNSDIVLLDRCIDRMCRFMDDCPDVGALGPATVDGEMRARNNCREFPSLRNLMCEALYLNQLFPGVHLLRGRILDNPSSVETRSVEVLSGCLLMIRRETLKDVGLLDESFFIYGEDNDWCKRADMAGWKRQLYVNARAIHYGGASSSKKPLRFIIEMRKAQRQYWRKHHRRTTVAVHFAIMVLHHSLRAFAWTFAYLFRKLFHSPKAKAALEELRVHGTLLKWFVFNQGRVREKEGES